VEQTWTASKIGMTGLKAPLKYGNGRHSAAAVIVLAARIKFASQSGELPVPGGPDEGVGCGVVIVVDVQEPKRSVP
jgi:hypothetical protein